MGLSSKFTPLKRANSRGICNIHVKNLILFLLTLLNFHQNIILDPNNKCTTSLMYFYLFIWIHAFDEKCRNKHDRKKYSPHRPTIRNHQSHEKMAWQEVSSSYQEATSRPATVNFHESRVEAACYHCELPVAACRVLFFDLL